FGKKCAGARSHGRTGVAEVVVADWVPPPFAHRVSSYGACPRVWEEMCRSPVPRANRGGRGGHSRLGATPFAHRVSSYGVCPRVWEEMCRSPVPRANGGGRGGRSRLGATPVRSQSELLRGVSPGLGRNVQEPGPTGERGWPRWP